MEFSLKEIPGGIPQGMRLFFQAEKGLTFGRDPALFLSPSSVIADIRKKWSDNPRFFENWITHNLVDNPHRLLTVVRKDSNNGKAVESEINSVLEARKNEYSKEKEDAFRQFQMTADKEEAIAWLRGLNK